MAINERNFQTIEYYRKETKFRRQYTEGLQNLLDGHGLSLLEAEILFAIFADPTCDTVTKLCADLGKTKGIVSLSCDRMSKHKFLSSRIDKKDRRVVHFHLLSAAKKVIESVSAYMEIMKDVQTAKETLEATDTSDLIINARIDLASGMIYPIYCKICDTCRFPGAPFRGYNDFIEEQCLTRIPSDHHSDLEQITSLSAISDVINEDQSILIKVPFQTNAGLYWVSLGISPVKERQNTAEFTIQNSMDAAN